MDGTALLQGTGALAPHLTVLVTGLVILTLDLFLTARSRYVNEIVGLAGLVLAFAFTPWILSVLSFLPYVGIPLLALSSLWVLVAGVVAIRQSLDFSTTRAVWTVVLGWFVVMALLIVLMAALVVGGFGG